MRGLTDTARDGGCALFRSTDGRIFSGCRRAGLVLALSCAGFAAAPASADPQTGTEGYVGLSLGYAGGGDDRVGLSPSGLVVGTLDNSGRLAGRVVGGGRRWGGLGDGIEREGQIARGCDSVATTGW